MSLASYRTAPPRVIRLATALAVIASARPHCTNISAQVDRVFQLPRQKDQEDQNSRGPVSEEEDAGVGFGTGGRGTG
jgi:hypothetical protein